MLVQESQGRQNLHSKSTDETKGNTLEVVLLDELIEVHAHEWEADTQVVTEIKRVLEVNDVGGSGGVVVTKVAQYLHLNQSLTNHAGGELRQLEHSLSPPTVHPYLLVETFLVSNDLHCNILSGLVVQASDNLSETSFPQHAQHLKPVAQVITHDELVITTFIIKVVVVGSTCVCANLLFRVSLSTPTSMHAISTALLSGKNACFSHPKVDLLVLQDLPLLVLCQFTGTAFQDLRWSPRVAEFL